MDFLVFAMTIIGLYCFFTKLGAGLGSVELFTERQYTCPTDFLDEQKKSDIIHAINCILLSLNGIVLMLFGLSYFGIVGNMLPSYILLVAAVINIVHIFVNKMVLNRTGLYKRMNDIMTQWKTQKRVTKTNDDEVRLYRMIKESVKNESYNLFYCGLLIVFYTVI